jgi:D-aspartate ligase
MAGFSRQVRGFFEMPNLLSAPDEHLERLIRLRASFDERPVLVPCDDLAVGAVARNRELLARSYDLVCPPPRLALELLDKARQYERLADRGIPLPRTWILQDPADSSRISREARFPLVVKPREAQEFFLRNGFKALRARTPDALVALSRRYERMIVQEEIPGGVESIYEHSTFVDRSGRVLVSSLTRKRDEYPRPFGNATAVELVSAPHIAELGRKVLAALEYRGMSHAEFKVDARDGTLKLIELNPRFTWSAALNLAARGDTIYPAYAEAAGTSLPESDPMRQRMVWLSPQRLTLGREFLPPPPTPDSLPGPTRYVTNLFDPAHPTDLAPLAVECFEGVRRRLRGRGRR